MIWVSSLLPTRAPAASSVSLHGISLPPLCALLAEPLLALSACPRTALWDMCLLRKESVNKEGCPVGCNVLTDCIPWRGSASLVPVLTAGRRCSPRSSVCTLPAGRSRCSHPSKGARSTLSGHGLFILKWWPFTLRTLNSVSRGEKRFCCLLLFGFQCSRLRPQLRSPGSDCRSSKQNNFCLRHVRTKGTIQITRFPVLFLLSVRVEGVEVALFCF